MNKTPIKIINRDIGYIRKFSQSLLKFIQTNSDFINNHLRKSFIIYAEI